MTDVKQINDLYIVDDANNTLVVDSANARVGIGVSNPGYPLSVSGAGNFTGNLTVSSIFKVDTAGSQITLGTSTAIPGNAVTIVGNTDIAGTTNTTILQLGGITVTATATELNQLSGVTLGTAASANTGDFATAAQGALANTALQTVAVDGVTITGDGTGGNPLVAAGGGISIGDAVGGGTSGSILFVDATTNLAQDNTQLFWDDTNNRLGVGTNTPSWTLEVNGGNANQIAVFRSTDSTARVNFADNSTTSDTHVGIGAAGDGIRLWANNQIVFSGASSGNVNFNSGKLATYNGASPLDGQLLIGNSGGAWEAATLTAGTNITITNAGGSITIDAAGGGSTPGGNPNEVQFNSAGSFGGDSNFVWDNINKYLGLGTATPAEALDVRGNVVIQDPSSTGTTDHLLEVKSDSSATPDNARILVSADTDAKLPLIHLRDIEANGGTFSTHYSAYIGLDRATPIVTGSAQNDFLIANGNLNKDIHFCTNNTGNGSQAQARLTIVGSDGDVGIGTTSPAQKLHVVGTIRQTNSTNAVLVSDANGDIGAAAALQDIAYLQPGQAETDTFTAVLSAPSWGPPGPPATIQDAIDRLASFVAGNLGPIP